MLQDTIKTQVVGIDIGYEQTTVALVDVRGNERAATSFSTTDYPNLNNYISRLSDEIVNLIESNGGYETIRSVGISSPSGNYLTGCIENSPRLPWKGQVPLAALLRDRLGLAVAVGNEAHVTALGEAAFGSAHGMKNFIVIVLAQGVGSCVFSNGRAHMGSGGFAGEFGHMCVEEDGRTCGCGGQGCLEAYCSWNGIIQTAQEMMAESDEPSLMRDLAELTPLTIKDCCDKGDKMAIEVFRKTGELLGISLANYASVVDPEAIIITGPVSAVGKWLLKPMDEAFESHVFHNITNKVKIFTSTLNTDEHSVLGASALAWSVKEYSLFK